MNYKAPDNSLHFLDDDSFAYLLPAGSVQISDEEAEALRVASLPPVDPKAAIQAEIDTLERTQLLPRITREFMLLQFSAVAAAQGVDPMTNIAYAKLKAFDDQVSALRAQL